MSSPTLPISNVVGLDFDTLKANLISFLQATLTINSFNYTGSNVNELLDILLAPIAYLSWYVYSVNNEMFIDSAQVRENLVSIVKEIDYVPESRFSARSIVNITVLPPSHTSNPPATIIIPQYTQFATSNSNGNFTFCASETYVAPYNPILNQYIFQNVTLIEGLPYQFTYVVNLEAIPAQEYIIPTPNVDTSTLTVIVQNSNSDTATNVFSYYGDVGSFINLDPTSNVYFLAEVQNTQYEVSFGDGILGTPLVDGNLVILNYQISNASLPNGCQVFTYAGTPISTFTNVVVQTVSAAGGGAEREGLDSVRYNAPLAYRTQNRAVTVYDYIQLVTQAYPAVASLNAWGGENAVPPQYGSVFLSLKPASGYAITDALKSDIINSYLQLKNVVPITPVLIDPDYIYVTINSLVHYNATLTTLPTNTIQTEVLTALQSFNNSVISAFNATFKYSNLLEAIDGADPSITDNLTSIQLEKQVLVATFNSRASYTFDFAANALIAGSLKSAYFYSNYSQLSTDTYYLSDDSVGNIVLSKISGSIISIVNTKIGTVNYSTGLVQVSNLYMTSLVSTINGSNIFSLYASPAVLNVTPLRNNIVTLDLNNIAISVVANPTNPNF